MTIWQSIILGAVEGLTEFLPISSTAHLILTSRLLGMATTDFLKTFEIAIQLGAIAAVAILYGRTFLQYWDINKKIITAFLPTALLGFLLYPVFIALLEGYAFVLGALFLGGIFLIVFEWRYKEKETAKEDLAQISYRQALGIGILQTVSIIPGVSRAAATMIGGLVFGLRRRAAVEFSFLLALPTMVAATGYDLLKNAGNLSSGQLVTLGVGFVVSAMTALLTMTLLLRFVKNNTLKSFGVYRMALVLIWFSVVKLF